MTPGRSVLRGFNKAFILHGRAGRAEYLWFLAFTITALIVCAQVPRWVSDGGQMPRDFLILMVAIVGILVVPILTATCRRLHDTGHSEGWVLLIFVPVFGWAVLAFFTAMRGDYGKNQFGPDPAPWRRAPRGDHPAIDAMTQEQEARHRAKRTV